MAVSRREKEKRAIRYADARQRIEDHEAGFTPTSFRVPEGLTQFRFKKEGLYVIDVVPYVVKVGKGQPGGNPYAHAGDVYWEMTFCTHRNIGPDNNDYCCLRTVFREPCPICEELARRRNNPHLTEEASKELRKALGEKERQLFLFSDQTTSESRALGVQPYECSHYMGFGELLEKKLRKARLKDEDHPHLKFFHLNENGLSLEVTAEEDSFQGRSYVKPTDIDFVPRKRPLDESLLDEVPCLEELLIKVPYKELKTIFLQTGTADKAEANGEVPKGDKSARKGAKAVKEEPPEDEEDEDEDLDEDEDTDDEEFEIKKGDSVSFTYRGKEHTGVVKTINEAKGLAQVKCPDRENLYSVTLSDLTLVEDEEPDEETEDLPTAEDLGIEKGSKVTHEEHGPCTVVNVSSDGTTVRLKDSDGETHTAVKVGEVTLIKAGKKEPPKKGGGKKTPPPEEEDEDELPDDEGDDEDLDEDEELGFDEDEEEEPPKKRGKK